MHRILYFAGFVYIALCGAIVAREVVARRAPTNVTVTAVPVNPPDNPPPTTSGGQWFAAIKQYCNPVEVDVRTRYSPPPSTSEGSGYLAACFGLAGKVDRARGVIEAMPRGDRGAAAGVLFEVAHPVADAGDDRASGPMMELVLEYWPNNYMALYHAGMSEYSLGQSGLAKKNLQAFLQLYNADDFFTQGARKALKSMGAGRDGKPVEQEPSAKP